MSRLRHAVIMTADLIALFRRLTAGVYVVGVGNPNRFDAFTAAAIMQVSYRPLLLALAINPRHASYELLRSGQAFCVSVLDHSQMDLAKRFVELAHDTGAVGVKVRPNGLANSVPPGRGYIRTCRPFAAPEPWPFQPTIQSRSPDSPNHPRA